MLDFHSTPFLKDERRQQKRYHEIGPPECLRSIPRVQFLQPRIRSLKSVHVNAYSGWGGGHCAPPTGFHLAVLKWLAVG